jgi:hypothetical protein
MTDTGRGGVLIDSRNILRPETVESLFLAYRVTGDEKYREAGWEVFQAFEKHCRVPAGGYVGIEDVQAVPPKQIDRMETFWMGETLSKSASIWADCFAAERSGIENGWDAWCLRAGLMLRRIPLPLV